MVANYQGGQHQGRMKRITLLDRAYPENQFSHIQGK